MRVLVEQATGAGWSLRRVRERVLRVAARLLLHGRRVVLVLSAGAAALWAALWPRLARVRVVAT